MFGVHEQLRSDRERVRRVSGRLIGERGDFIHKRTASVGSNLHLHASGVDDVVVRHNWKQLTVPAAEEQRRMPRCNRCVKTLIFDAAVPTRRLRQNHLDFDARRQAQPTSPTAAKRAGLRYRLLDEPHVRRKKRGNSQNIQHS